MKRRILVILCICLLLSGCQTPVQTTVPTTQTASVPLLDQGTWLEESSNLLYIPCKSLEQMMSPELLALQPEGFSYAMVYDNFPQEYMEYLDSGYFVSDYSMSFPAEDRSELMEAAMYLEYWLFEPGTGRHEKMQYFADCICDCFDTSSLPEMLPWERVLQ